MLSFDQLCDKINLITAPLWAPILIYELVNMFITFFGWLKRKRYKKKDNVIYLNNVRKKRKSRV